MSWQVGDLAVCVDVTPSHEGYAPPELVLGRVYTVYAVGVDPFGSVGLFIDEQESRGFAGGYLAHRFRKIHPADDAFTEQMRSLRPKADA